MDYLDGQEVIVHSLGDEKVYIGIIRGIISKCNGIVSYMVEIDIEDEYQYSVRCIPESCIKPMPESITDKPNKYLDELCKGGIPIEITECSPEALEALAIINGDCCYKDCDFSNCVYNDGNGWYVVIW